MVLEMIRTSQFLGGSAFGVPQAEEQLHKSRRSTARFAFQELSKSRHHCGPKTSITTSITTIPGERTKKPSRVIKIHTLQEKDLRTA